MFMVLIMANFAFSSEVIPSEFEQVEQIILMIKDVPYIGKHAHKILAVISFVLTFLASIAIVLQGLYLTVQGLLKMSSHVSWFAKLEGLSLKLEKLSKKASSLRELILEKLKRKKQ
jgi:hypothetical protein